MAESNLGEKAFASQQTPGNSAKAGRAPKSFLAPDACNKDEIVKDRWKVIEKLGAGTFGQVYKVLDVKTDTYWALKIELINVRKPVLRMDVTITRALEGKTHAPLFLACGHTDKFTYLVTQLLGRNLSWRKRNVAGGRLSLRTTVRIGLQTIDAVRDLHEIGFLHRDIKPSNLVTGIGDQSSVIYLIDFGLARKYVDDKKRIYPPRTNVNFRGTVRYASRQAHKRIELSRADDLWSLIYTMIDLYVGRLPWHTRTDMHEIGFWKENVDPPTLCTSCPAEWRRIVDYLEGLRYESVPDYEYLQRLLNAKLRLDKDNSEPFDWDWESAEFYSENSQYGSR